MGGGGGEGRRAVYERSVELKLCSNNKYNGSLKRLTRTGPKGLHVL